ncbi:growth-regulating factor 1-like isoform X1 [Chenopodium quinoa]|uniref:Growth-regulating factor n=1 Tax=Chenopodium quinoa TaxID=63459 RepID=A0A803MRJ3_CHEQI|nr:growth-regulating factor 1-like isoform X1 [Chenopodium quinoa]
MEFGLMGNMLIGSTEFSNKEMPSSRISDDNWKPTKIAKLSNAFSDWQQEQNLLSFSSPKSSTIPFFQHPNSFYSKNAGYTCNGSVNASMCLTNGVRAPFTPSQWFELEQQALIYKYIIANVPIPPNLLIPIRRAFESAGFSSFSSGLLSPSTFGWGPFHLGFANSADPEPGRCRRTDGKKWRCSRDAVPDQKYCERHMNRGRHRSRKPVEGHPGRSISGVTTNKTSSSTTNVMNSASSSSALVVPGGGTSNSFAINLDQSKDIQPVPPNHLPSSLVNRHIVNIANSSQGMQGDTGLDFQYPKISLNSNGNKFSVTESTAGNFAFLTSDAILNTTHTDSSVSRSYGPTHDLNAQRSNPQHSNHSMDDQSSILWSKLQTQTDRTTQLSISIPPADFMSSTSSPTGENVALSPLRLSREFDTVQMGLGVNTVTNDRRPSSWETSLGGPLGEVLKTTTNISSGIQSKSILPLNLLSKGWDGKPQPASSPTGVLGYFSNSSAGSSPKAESGKALETSTLSGDLIGFTLGSSSSLPIF